MACSGCAGWSNEQPHGESPWLRPPQQSPDSVTIKTVLVRFPADKLDELNQAWAGIDESIHEIELRKLLDQNGLRAGLLIGDIPPVIRRQIDATSAEQTNNALEHAGLAADVDNRTHLLQCSAGQRKEILVRREVQEPLTVLSIPTGGSITGDTYLRPAVLFDLRVSPQDAGRANVQLTPEIQHGSPQQSYVSTEFGVRSELARARRRWQDLTIRAQLSPGQILVVAGTQPVKALGRALFTTQTAAQTEEHVVLLLRLVEPQLDDLFVP